MTLVCTFCVSGGLCLAFIPRARALALRYRLVDAPDDRRKMHARAIPTAGGLAIFAASVVTLAGVLLLPRSWTGLPSVPWNESVGLLAAALVLCCVGVADDYGLLRGRHKLAGQVVATGVLMAFGVVVRNVHVLDWNVE